MGGLARQRDCSYYDLHTCSDTIYILFVNKHQLTLQKNMMHLVVIMVVIMVVVVEVSQIGLVVYVWLVGRVC